MRNPDYHYAPKPMSDMPPISAHEFYRRFYFYCQPRSLLHWHIRCRQIRGHCREVLDLLPKKVSELEESGDQRETFWGIYAREIVCLRWVLFYNSLCILPLVWFFFMWTFKWGRNHDLQGAAIPISVMLSMLSVFWSLFLGSLRFGTDY
jgi:hypothetical protein